jgi:hypothetical protein
MVFVLLSTGVARADTAQECVEAHLQSQRLRTEGKLRAARVQLLSCVRPECPALARADCGPWLQDVETLQPTVVVAATDRTGRETGAVRVSVDGELLVAHLDGRPLDVDPGDHLMRFQTEDGGVVEQRVFVNVGEKNRVLRVAFGPRTPPVPPRAPPVQQTDPQGPRAQTTPTPVWGWVATGVGVLGVGSFVYFGLTGRSSESNLSNSCAPRCTEAQRDDVLRDYRIADVSLGVGIVSLAIGAWLLFVHRGAPSLAAKAPASAWVGVNPARGGGTLGVTATF